MKKLYSLFLMLAMMVALSSSTCSGSSDNDNDGIESSSVLVGTWDIVSSRYYSDNGWEDFEEGGGYYVFTKDKVTFFGDDDLLDGRPLSYTFDGKELIISGYPLWTVLSLSNSTMVLKTKIINGYQETTFKKRFDDNDETSDVNGNSSNIFSITIDGKKKEYSQTYLNYMDLLGTWNKPNLIIGTDIGDFRFRFPSGITFSSFTTGYCSFEDDAEKITIGVSSIPCTHVYGSATVLSNDGKNMKVRFNNYKFTWNTSRDILFDGTLNFVMLIE